MLQSSSQVLQFAPYAPKEPNRNVAMTYSTNSLSQTVRLYFREWKHNNK